MEWTPTKHQNLTSASDNAVSVQKQREQRRARLACEKKEQRQRRLQLWAKASTSPWSAKTSWAKSSRAEETKQEAQKGLKAQRQRGASRCQCTCQTTEQRARRLLDQSEGNAPVACVCKRKWTFVFVVVSCQALLAARHCHVLLWSDMWQARLRSFYSSWLEYVCVWEFEFGAHPKLNLFFNLSTWLDCSLITTHYTRRHKNEKQQQRHNQQEKYLHNQQLLRFLGLYGKI